MKPLTWQNPEQLLVAQVLKKIFYNSVAELRLEKKADFQSEMSNYDNLLKYVDKFLGELRKQLRDGKFTEDGYNDLVSEYNDVISRYNSFIN